MGDTNLVSHGNGPHYTCTPQITMHPPKRYIFDSHSRSFDPPSKITFQAQLPKLKG